MRMVVTSTLMRTFRLTHFLNPCFVFCFRPVYYSSLPLSLPGPEDILVVSVRAYCTRHLLALVVLWSVGKKVNGIA